MNRFRCGDRPTRRDALIQAAATATAVGGSASALRAVSGMDTAPAQHPKALVAITLDLEMSRNFPRWTDTEWDYKKGDLSAEAKQYTSAACELVKARGGVVHNFVVGQVFEQPDIGWLKKILEAGHPIGNHTYDHVNVLAKTKEQIQYRFARAPWLLGGRTVSQAIRENIQLCNQALQHRLGTEPAGFRTPGGFSMGLRGRPDLQAMMLDLGFSWISSQYPRHTGIADLHGTQKSPSREAYESIVAAQRLAQPYAYPSGLIEVPMSPISDIGAFRNGRWKLDYFLRAIRMALDWVIGHNAVFDFLAHPSCLGIVDPNLKAIKLICDIVDAAGGRAEIVGLDALARRASQKAL